MAWHSIAWHSMAHNPTLLPRLPLVCCVTYLRRMLSSAQFSHLQFLHFLTFTEFLHFLTFSSYRHVDMKHWLLSFLDARPAFGFAGIQSGRWLDVCHWPPCFPIPSPTPCNKLSLPFQSILPSSQSGWVLVILPFTLLSINIMYHVSKGIAPLRKCHGSRWHSVN